jgi:V8-like Glu-specific endopeptidase
MKAEKAVDPNVQLNFVSTNDIIGGNSGSPVIGRNGEAIGLIFDGNIQSLGGDFGYDGSQNRAIAVDVTGITEALKHIYHADRLVKELTH